MHAPRRVPYRSLSDLAALHAQIYTPPSPPTPPPQLALYAHHSPTSLPVALSLTLSLLSALSLPPSQAHAKRLALASALVRLVNSLVDPLQQGLYARPIAVLAAELGLPGWLVELRHAATHDELPSLALLLDGAREALAYLDRAYWLPTLNPPQQVSSTESWGVHEALLPGLLASYKPLAKALARDSTVFNGPFKACMGEIKGWVAAPGDERRALVMLVGRLVDGEAGLLVPLAKKKRPLFNSSAPHPSPSLLAIYYPLLSTLAKAHPTFPALLVDGLAHALSNNQRQGGGKSERATWKAWLVWTVEVLLPRASSTATGIGQSSAQTTTTNALLAALAKRAFGSDEVAEVVRVLAGRQGGQLGVGLRGVVGLLGGGAPADEPPTADGPDPGLAATADADADGDSPMDPLPLQSSSSTFRPPPGGDQPPPIAAPTTKRSGKLSQAASSTPSVSAAGGGEGEGVDAAREAGWVRVPVEEWVVRPMGVRVGE